MLRFAITASSSAPAGRLADDLGRYMQAALGQRCQVELCSSFAEIADELLEGRASVGWLPPFAYVRICRVGEVRLLLRAVRARQRSYYSVLFTRADSPIRELDQLRGRRVAWVDSMSASGYLFPLAGLIAAGVPEESLASSTFEGSHTRVVQAVIGDRADAGATFCTWQGGEPSTPVHSAGWTEGGFIPRPAVRVLARFGPVPGDTICAGAGVRRADRDAVIQAMAWMHRSEVGALVARGIFGVTRFEPALPQHYETVAEAARTIGMD
ncbi:MAG: phosphate/phosphite/phosphonate ABC transporter substrate-binding protein [Deltaproteobacteria bacterium]|nr:phosphate/phosphite/phosphonate ABC transporter substrate-binding protein [Deltaproteobacteria bacterium]